jgi:hypothetical protein
MEIFLFPLPNPGSHLVKCPCILTAGDGVFSGALLILLLPTLLLFAECAIQSCNIHIFTGSCALSCFTRPQKHPCRLKGVKDSQPEQPLALLLLRISLTPLTLNNQTLMRRKSNFPPMCMSLRGFVERTNAPAFTAKRSMCTVLVVCATKLACSARSTPGLTLAARPVM